MSLQEEKIFTNKILTKLVFIKNEKKLKLPISPNWTNRFGMSKHII